MMRMAEYSSAPPAVSVTMPVNTINRVTVLLALAVEETVAGVAFVPPNRAEARTTVAVLAASVARLINVAEALTVEAVLARNVAIFDAVEEARATVATTGRYVAVFANAADALAVVVCAAINTRIAEMLLLA